MNQHDVVIPRLLKRKRPIILDLGSHDGTAMLPLLAKLDHPRIFSFEPDPRTINLLRARMTGRVEIFEMAVGAFDGETDFHLSMRPDLGPFNPIGWCSGSTHKPTGHLTCWPGVEFNETVKVQVRTLDTIAKLTGVDHVDLIWADTQGAEADIIKGGAATLAVTEYFMTEVAGVPNSREGAFGPIFEGQPVLPELLAMLPGWELLWTGDIDIFLRNAHYRRK
jgi:FkbM family methyltransferase